MKSSLIRSHHRRKAIVQQACPTSVRQPSPPAFANLREPSHDQCRTIEHRSDFADGKQPGIESMEKGDASILSQRSHCWGYREPTAGGLIIEYLQKTQYCDARARRTMRRPLSRVPWTTWHTSLPYRVSCHCASPCGSCPAMAITSKDRKRISQSGRMAARGRTKIRGDTTAAVHSSGNEEKEPTRVDPPLEKAWCWGSDTCDVDLSPCYDNKT